MAFGDADASSPAFVASSTGWTTIGGTTAPFTPPANSLVRAWVFSDTAGGNVTNTETVTDSLAGATGWVFQGSRSRPDSGAQNARVALYTKYYAASPGAITVTAIASATGATDGALSVKVVAGCMGIEGLAEGSNTAAAMSINVTTVTAGARCEMAGTDWNVAANPTAPAGQTALRSQGVGAGPDIRIYIGIMNAVTAVAGTVETLATASPTAANTNNFMAFAYTPAAGGGGATVNATMAATLDSPAATLITAVRHPAVLAVTLASPVATIIAKPRHPAVLAATLASPAGMLLAKPRHPAVLATTLAGPTGTLLALPRVKATLLATLASPAATLLATPHTPTGTVFAVLSTVLLSPGASALARPRVHAQVLAILPGPTATIVKDVTPYVTAVLTAGASTSATLTAGARVDATLTLGSLATATLTASTL